MVKPSISQMMNTSKIEAEKEYNARRLNNEIEHIDKKWKTLNKYFHTRSYAFSKPRLQSGARTRT